MTHLDFLEAEAIYVLREVVAQFRVPSLGGRASENLHAHHAAPLTLDELAGQANLSRYHFLRLFRAALGATPHQYLIRVRLERAKALLVPAGG